MYRAILVSCTQAGLMMSPKRYAQVLVSGTCQCDLIWKYSFCRGNKVTMMTWYIRVYPKSSGWCFCTSKEREIWTQTQRRPTKGRRPCDEGDSSDAAIGQGICETASSHQKLGGGREGFFPWDFGGSMALPTPWFWISSRALRE